MAKNILFQGDSITESQRFREFPDHMGSGFAIMVAGKMGFEHPGEYVFINRGIAGQKSTDVYARIKEDIIDEKPYCMSLLVGVNDVWHGIDYNWGETPETYERVLCSIIEETVAAVPDVKIMLIEPFVLKEYSTCSTEEKPDKWETFRREVDIRRQIAKETAEKYSLKFVTLQDKFDAAAEKTGVAFWLEDGVHPSPAGHELIAREWIKAYYEMFPEEK